MDYRYQLWHVSVLRWWFSVSDSQNARSRVLCPDGCNTLDTQGQWVSWGQQTPVITM